MKKHRIQLVLLSLILIAAIVGGIFLLTYSRQDSPEAENPSPSPANAEPIGTIVPSDERLQFELISHSEAPIADYMEYLEYLFSYHNQPARLRFCESDDAFLEIVSLADGEVLQKYPYDCFDGGEFLPALYMDADEVLWGLWYDFDENTYSVGQIKQGQTPQDQIQLGQNLFQYTCGRFAVSLPYAALLGDDENGMTCVVLYNTETGKSVRLDDVDDFYMDEGGYLYLTQSGYLVKRALDTDSTVWKQALTSPESYQKLWYQSELGLFSLCGNEGRILCCDMETGETSYELFNMLEDSDLSYQDMMAASFAVDADANVFFARMDTNFSQSGTASQDLSIWQYAPFIPDVADEDKVCLTITAPYRVDSIDASIRVYQRQHPEVTIEWDTQYTSRNAFLEHADQYAEQLTLRTMTGDVGDIQMVSGTGMDLGAVLNTDVMADLSEYLSEDPSIDELAANLLEPLYEEDGKIRAIPLGVRPVYLLYNQRLAARLGISLDPSEITWSDLLDLALAWSDSGEQIALFASDGTASVETILSHIILANLDEFELEDGTVNFEQPWFEDLLSKLNELQGSSQLFITPGVQQWWAEGFMENSLLFMMNGANYEDTFTRLAWMQEREGEEYCVIPLPRGEFSDARQSYGFCWGIPASSEHQEEAWEFLSFIISRDGFVTDTYDASTFSLNNISDRERFEAAKHMHPEILETHYEQFQLVRTSPISRYAEPYGWSDAILTPISEYMAGETTLAKALREAAENWERVLKE